VAADDGREHTHEKTLRVREQAMPSGSCTPPGAPPLSVSGSLARADLNKNKSFRTNKHLNPNFESAVRAEVEVKAPRRGQEPSMACSRCVFMCVRACAFGRCQLPPL